MSENLKKSRSGRKDVSGQAGMTWAGTSPNPQKVVAAFVLYAEIPLPAAFTVTLSYHPGKN